MGKKDSKKGAFSDDSENVPQGIIGILFKSFVQSTSMGPHTHQCSYKRWSAGQIVTNKDDIEMLKKLNAPIGLYIKYVDGTAKS